jgi:hypothetical protein
VTGFLQQAAVLQFLLVAAAFAALIEAFVASDFSLKLAFENSHSLMPLIYKVTSVWGNHEGSMVLWVFILIGMFVSGAITHVCLMLLGGANQPYETTLRVMSYSSGSASVLQLIPLCGGMISGIYTIVLNCIGLARAHQTDTWRAVLAVLLPAFICCGLVFFVVFAIIGSAAAFST